MEELVKPPATTPESEGLVIGIWIITETQGDVSPALLDPCFDKASDGDRPATATVDDPRGLTSFGQRDKALGGVLDTQIVS